MNILLLAIVSLHAFHLSVTEIEIGTDGSLEVVMSLFADDLEKAVNTTVVGQLDIFDQSTYETQKELIANYVFQQTSIEVNGKTIELNYLGHEIENNKCNIYLEAEQESINGTITYKNHALMDIYRDQKNMVHWLSKENQETFLFQGENDLMSILIN